MWKTASVCMLMSRRRSVADVGHESHETRSLDGGGDGVLAGGRAAGLAAADDLALAVSDLFEKLKILVVHVHGTRALAVDVYGVLLLAADLRLRASFSGPSREFLCHLQIPD